MGVEAGKGNAWAQIAELLKRLGTRPKDASGVERPGVPPEGTFRNAEKGRLDEEARRIKIQAKKWASEVITDNDAQRAKSQKEMEDQQQYSNDNLNESRKKLIKAQGGDAVTGAAGDRSLTPEGLESNPDNIYVPAVAEFTASITAIANGPAEYRDPNIIYSEVGKLYRSIDWKNTTPEQKREIRRTVEAGLKYAKRLASTDSSTGFLDIITHYPNQEEADYYLRLGIEGDEPFDLYRSRTVPEQFSENQEVDGHKLSSDEAQQLNTQRTEVENLLRNAQDKLNIAGDVRAEEIKILERVQDKLDDAFEQGKYRHIAEEYRDVVARRLKHLREDEARAGAQRERFHRRGRGSTGYLGEIPEADQVQPDEQQKLIGDIPPEARNIAKKIFGLPSQEGLTITDLNGFRDELNKNGFNNDNIDAFIKSKISASPGTDEYIKEYSELSSRVREKLQVLDNIIFDKSRPFMDEGRGRAYFEQYPEELAWLMDDKEFIIPDNYKDPKNINDPKIFLENSTMERLLQIANGILDRGAMNDRASFRDNFDLFDNENWKLMISRVEKVCRNHGWETPEIKQLTMKFSGLREMHEMVHDLQFAKNFANLETLSKMVGNTLAGDLDTWIWYTPTMRYALAVYSENIRHIMRLHGGYLPPELMDQSSIFVTELDQNAKEHFRQLVKSGKITELNSLNKKLKSENTKEKQKAAEEMHRALRVARAFGTITLRLPSMISEAKIPRWYGSGPDNNLIQDMDPFRHLIFKYGMGKPALAKLYTTLGGDEKAAMQFSSMSEDEIYEVFNRTEQDPAFADTYANFRNFFKMATRLGDGKGFWGMILGMKEFPQELREVRGVGLKLLDARRRAELEIRAQKLNRRFKPDNRGVPPSEQSGNPEISRAWRKYSKEKSIQNEIANLTKIYTDEAMNELVNKLPGEVIDRTSLDAGYEHLGFDAVEHTLEGQRPDLFKKILRVDDGTKDGALLKITINGVQHEIRSFYELYSIDPRNNPTEVHIGIPESERQDLVRRIDLMNKVSYQLAGDLSIVQQVAINQIIDNAIKGISFDPKKMDATFLDGYMDALADSVGEESGLKLEPSDRRTMTQEYIKQIHTAINTDLDEQKKPIQPYVKHLTQRFINGYEHNIFTTSDVPLDKIHYRNWGSSVLSRTVGDALSVSTGEKGLADYFGLFEGQPDQKILFQTLKEKIKTPIASADPDTAINISGWCIDAFLRQYRESDLATYTGIFGRALTSTIAIETTEKISHFLGQHGRIPRFMWGSLSQRLIDPGAMRMTASDVWSFTREAAEKGLLPKDENVAGWQMSGSYRPGYTKNDLRNRYHGNLINVVPQIGTTVTPLSMGFMIYQGIKERDEEKH